MMSQTGSLVKPAMENQWDPWSQLLEHHTPVTTLRCSKDGTRLASGTRDGSVTIWDVVGWTPLTTLETGIETETVAFSRDNMSVVTADREGTIRVWDASSGDCLKSTEASNSVRSRIASSNIVRVFLSHDGTVVTIVTGKRDLNGLHEAATWDISSGVSLSTLDFHCGNVDYDLAISDSGARLALSAGKTPQDLGHS